LRVMPAAPSREPSARRAWSNWPENPRLARLRSLAARTWAGNRLFIIVLIPAFLLRVDAELGYRWQAWFNDSFEYLSNTIYLKLDPTRTSGYSIWLKLLQPFHSYALVTILQHLMGLAVAVMIYALARHRFGIRQGLATLAVVPVLYDGYEIELEHLIMADVPFLFLLTLAVTLLLWDPAGPSVRMCAVIGGLLGIGSVLRSIGTPLLAIFAVYMIIRRYSWRKVAATIVVCLIPLAAYAAVFDFEYGQFAESDSSGVFLYGRVMTFADCAKMHVPADELFLCTTVPPAQRPIAESYDWDSLSPIDRLTTSKFTPLPNQLGKDFAIRAIEAQPLSYARVVFDDTWRVFAWKRYVFPNAQTYDEYIFRAKPTPIPDWDKIHLGRYNSWAAAYVHGNPNTQVVAPFANLIRGYQQYVWLPGSVYGLILLTGLGGLLLAWRRLGGEALLPWTISLALIVIPAATAEFDYRYVLPAVPFACLAAVIAFSPDSAGGRWLRRLAGRRRGRAEIAGTSPASPASAAALQARSVGVAEVAGSSPAGAGDDQRDLAADGT
jgi:hypothetical protein